MKIFLLEKQSDSKWHKPEPFRDISKAITKIKSEYKCITNQLKTAGIIKEYCCIDELDDEHSRSAFIGKLDDSQIITWRITEIEI